MRKTKPFQVPEQIWKAAEEKAKERRKKTGALIRWSDIIHEILAEHLIAK
jgi:hypothetical protein